MLYLKKFSQFVFEELDITQVESELSNIQKVANALKDLLELGLIDQSGYQKDFSELWVTYRKLIKGLKLNLKEQADFQILKRLSSLTGLASLEALDSPEAQALFSKGVRLVSSPTQLLNGTLIFSMDPEYRRHDGWGIGLFPGPKTIRRITPKGINLKVWHRDLGSIDIPMKKIANAKDTTDFYKKAMQWAADNIDFNQVIENPDPSVWKYYTKQTVKNRQKKYNENN